MQNDEFKVLIKPSNKNTPNFSHIPNQKFTYQALSKYTKIGIHIYQLATLNWMTMSILFLLRWELVIVACNVWN